jgi:hypothetical protein
LASLYLAAIVLLALLLMYLLSIAGEHAVRAM